jgi:hypothetical protein
MLKKRRRNNLTKFLIVILAIIIVLITISIIIISLHPKQDRPKEDPSYNLNSKYYLIKDPA